MLNINDIIKKSKEVSYDLRSDIFKKLDMDYCRHLMENDSAYYKILTAIALLKPDYQYLELGTSFGASALAYRYGNPKTTIYTYDIENNHKFIADDISGILVRKDDVTRCKFDIPKPDFIFIDISHNGTDEHNTLKSLESQGFLENCIVMLDDIHFNKEMEILWAAIHADEKYDVTTDGHATGTGIFICRK